MYTNIINTTQKSEVYVDYVDYDLNMFLETYFEYL